MFFPTDRHFKCELPSWRRVARDTKKLSVLIKNSGYIPQIVIAIGRGGLVPARILCDYLHIKDLATIKVEHWGIVATPSKKAIIKFPLNVDIKDRKVLLMDDITDTGDTLRISFEYLKGFGPQEIRTAVIIHKTTSDFIPDYYGRRIIKWRWVTFPWHVWEDLTAFVKEIRAHGFQSEVDIQQELRGRYNIDIDLKLIKEIMSDVR